VREIRTPGSEGGQGSSQSCHDDTPGEALVYLPGVLRPPDERTPAGPTGPGWGHPGAATGSVQAVLPWGPVPTGL